MRRWCGWKRLQIPAHFIPIYVQTIINYYYYYNQSFPPKNHNTTSSDFVFKHHYIIWHELMKLRQMASRYVGQRHKHIVTPSKASSEQTSHPAPARQQPPTRTPPPPPGPSHPRRPSRVPHCYLKHRGEDCSKHLQEFRIYLKLDENNRIILTVRGCMLFVFRGI